MTYSLSDNKKKLTFNFAKSSELNGSINMNKVNILMKLPIKDNIEIKTTCYQGDVEIGNTDELGFDSDSTTIGTAIFNGPPITIQNTNDLLTTGYMAMDYSINDLDNTNTSDIVVTIEITN